MLAEMRAGRPGTAIAICTVLAAAGCGGSGDEDSTVATVTSSPAPVRAEPTAPPKAGVTSDPGHGGAAGEASPEAPAEGPGTGELSGSDEEAVSGTVTAYLGAINRRQAAGVCSSLAAGALLIRELPRRRGGCRRSVAASLGTRPPGGGPAWSRTRLVELSAVSVEGGGARVTATVIHRFRDRKQPSIEEDVLYLERVGDRWLLAKPSATFYRAVGYADPPLRALTPP